MRNHVEIRLTLLLFLLLFTGLESRLQAQPVKGTVITVNDVGDSLDASPGNGICADAAGKCTLRAAIAESNSSVGQDVIIFDVPVPAVITLTLGELKVTSPVSILGRGARRLTIQRSSSPNVSLFRIFHLAAYTTMRGMTIRNGNYISGGGILAAAQVNLLDLAIIENSADAGGGLAFQSAEPAFFQVVERCLISSNNAQKQGGGVYIAPAMTVHIKSSTVTGNSAPGAGAVSNNGWLILVNSTIARNSASQGSSIVNAIGAKAEILNTIIGPDTGQPGTSVEGQFTSLGSNIVTHSTGSGGWVSSDQVGTNNSIDPMLGNLADNGGQTDTIALLPGSSAIDRGDDCAVIFSFHCDLFDEYRTERDHRKFVRRVATHVDIGAVESGSTLGSGTTITSLFFGQTHQIAYSRVTVINSETLEKRTTFIALRNDIQRLRGGTRPMSFDVPGVYVAEVHTKRAITSSPQVREF